MHELAVCQGLIAQVERIAAVHEARVVERIDVQIGPLAGVVPQLLLSAYSIARAGTVAAEADLVIEETGLRVHCTACGAESEAKVNRLLCSACGNWRVRVLAGEELVLKSVELRRPSAPA